MTTRASSIYLRFWRYKKYRPLYSPSRHYVTFYTLKEVTPHPHSLSIAPAKCEKAVGAAGSIVVHGYLKSSYQI